MRIAKRIPLQSGLGGGSSDAAAAIRGLTRLWRVTLAREVERGIAARIGADVPFFLEGGTALGLDRGDLLFPLAEGRAAWVTLVIPAFGVSTKDAFGWFDADATVAAQGRGAAPALPSGSSKRGRSDGERTSKGGPAGELPRSELRNDLQPPVAARHPEIARSVRALRRHGAGYAAMSGSGSAVFGMFPTRIMAMRAARALEAAGRRSLVTRTTGRHAYAALSQPRQWRESR